MSMRQSTQTFTHINDFTNSHFTIVSINSDSKAMKMYFGKKNIPPINYYYTALTNLQISKFMQAQKFHQWVAAKIRIMNDQLVTEVTVRYIGPSG